MKATHFIAAAMAALPIHAAGAQEAEPEGGDRGAPAAQGVRIEILGGYDHDGFEGGMFYGGRIGYDFGVTRNLLLGVDAEFTEVTTDQEFQFPGFPSLTAKDGPDAYVGGRATFALSSRFRLHGAGGYTRARHGSFFLTGNNQVGIAETAHDGFRLSAGGQFLISRKAFIGAEYRYSEYENFFGREQFVASIGFRF